MENSLLRNKSLNSSSGGFTLIEIIVVLVILGLLASVAVPKILGRTDEARIIKAQTDILAIKQSLKLYKLDNHVYPTTDQGLEALVNKPSTGPAPLKWKKGGYLEKLPTDPWGADYRYLSPGKRGDFDVYSFAADGREGGKEDNADIGSWQ